MKRREFITLLGGAAAAWPLDARAQQGDRVRRIGLLESGTESDPIVQACLAAFREKLEKLGWIEHQNVRIDYRFAHASAEQGQVLAKELVALRPDVILARTTPMAAALQRESRAIPIVFVEVSDPINSGFVASLARPGGNLTGLLLYEEGITGKWLAMLKEIAPHLVRVALVANPKTTPYNYFLRTGQAAARSLEIALVSNPVESAVDIERTIDSFARVPNGGIVVPPDSTAFFHRDLIIRLAAQHHLPSAHSARWWVEGGALMSYGTDRVDAFRQVASFVDRILRGSNPGDLPVQTPTKYETVVNLKNGEGARPRSTVIAFGARRRGDRMRCERRMNPKCHSRTVCDTFSARSADSTGLFLMPITRREFITLLGGAAAAWPLAARAQQAAMPLVGYVSSASADASYMAAFRQGLADLGHTEGHNAAIEFRWADGKFERLPALLADLIQRRVAVIAVGGITSGLAAKAATTTIPIVFLAADDPVKFGLVTSLNRPGGNATGLNLLTSELNTKRLELIRDLVPTASAVAVLVNPRSPESEPQTRDIERVAGAVGQQIRILNASSDRDIDAAFATLIKPRDAALLVTNDALFDSSRVQIVALAASRAIPTIYDRRAYADAGGLMSYGTHYLDGHRRLGIYTAKILNGAKPADLPVEQSTKFELVINLKTAKALGLEVPPTLLARADEVIE